jgi:hypothetical protein
MRDAIRATIAVFGLALAAFAGLLSPAARADDVAVRVDVDWAAFLAGHDLVWTRLPEKYGERPFLGNCQLGSMIYRAGDEIRVPLGRTDVQDHRDGSSGWAAYSRPRFLLGELALKPAGRIRGGRLRLDLWNAEVRGEIVTDKGTVRITQFIPTEEMGVVTVLRPSDGEADCRWTWLPGVPETTADIEAYAKNYGAQRAATLKLYVPNPPVRYEEAGPVRVAVQDLLAGGGYAVAWTEKAGGDGSRVLYVGTGNSYPGRTAAGRPRRAPALRSCGAQPLRPTGCRRIPVSGRAGARCAPGSGDRDGKPSAERALRLRW